MNRSVRTIQNKVTAPRTAGIAWLLVLALLALAACNAATDPSDLDQAAIYAAVIRQIYTMDDTFGGNLNPPVLYLVRATDDSVGDPELGQSPSVRLSEEVQEEISQALADLPTEIVWVDAADQVARDAMGRPVGEGAIITVGNVHPQDDASVHVPGSIYVAMLAAGGQTYVLEQVDGSWEVTGTTGVLWMS